MSLKSVYALDTRNCKGYSHLMQRFVLSRNEPLFSEYYTGMELPLDLNYSCLISLTGPENLDTIYCDNLELIQ